MEATERLGLTNAELLIKSAFVAVGVPEGPANSVAKALVAAEAEGQVGHGFSRVEDYVAQVRTGKITADAVVTIEEIGTTSLLADAGNGFAYPALDLVIEHGVALARNHGCVAMGVTRSHHCGAFVWQRQNHGDGDDRAHSGVGRSRSHGDQRGHYAQRALGAGQCDLRLG